jgi:hypothetical protein
MIWDSSHNSTSSIFESSNTYSRTEETQIISSSLMKNETLNLKLFVKERFIQLVLELRVTELHVNHANHFIY